MGANDGLVSHGLLGLLPKAGSTFTCFTSQCCTPVGSEVSQLTTLPPFTYTPPSHGLACFICFCFVKVTWGKPLSSFGLCVSLCARRPADGNACGKTDRHSSAMEMIWLAVRANRCRRCSVSAMQFTTSIPNPRIIVIACRSQSWAHPWQRPWAGR